MSIQHANGKVNPQKKFFVLHTVADFFNMNDPTSTELVIKEMFREFVCGQTWAQEVTQEHKFHVFDTIDNLQEFVKQLGGCNALPGELTKH